MLEFPPAVDFDIVIFVPSGEPELAIAFAEGERPQEIPAPVRLSAVHGNARIEDIVLGEADPLGEALEQLPQFRMSLRAPYAFSFPNTILGENRHNPVLVVIVIANITVFGFELLDCLDVLQN